MSAIATYARMNDYALETCRSNSAYWCSSPEATVRIDDSDVQQRYRNPLAPRWRPGHSLAGPPRHRRRHANFLAARAATRRARGVGRAPAREAGSARHLGRRAVVGRRAVSPEMDLHDLHHAAAPRLWSA